MTTTPSQRLTQLPPYLFAVINKLKLDAYARNLDVIDLGMGNPDLPTDPVIVERLAETVREHPRTHRYPQAKGMPKFRAAVSEWFAKRFGVKFDPDSEVLALVGSKEGVAHLCMAFLDAGDHTLIPEPAYPVYYNTTVLAGGVPHLLPITEANGYLPDLGSVPADVLQRTKILFLNYPNNPTAAVVSDDAFLKDAIRFARKHDLVLCYDNAYSELTFDGYVAPSIFQYEGARDVAVEFHSFSKTFSMAGWRLGFVVGNPRIVGVLEKFKSFVDYGSPSFVQLAGVKALAEHERIAREVAGTYRTRRDLLVRELARIGWQVTVPRATMYLWAKLPERITREVGSLKFTETLLRDTGVVLSPGVGFGPSGEGYVRISLVTANNRFHDAALRIDKVFKQFGVRLRDGGVTVPPAP
jgi:LL-diaminopimelate aminotransferase